MTARNVGTRPSAKEERKLRKPLIERKRRERINHCLDQLKETVAGAFRLDQSKLEKADILEMTVKHLRNVQNDKVNDPPVGLEAQQKYGTGYIQCMHEVHNMLLACDWVDKALGSRLLNHLLKSLPRATDERRLQSPPRHDAPPRGLGIPGTPLRGDPLAGREADGCPESPGLHSFPLQGMLEMWRPW
ncbi:hairy-related 8.2 [Brachionichthys hirsutus]|uniref:hairy-related 8.2 n=1 Tax=Brachionichthys hirsutus TaxID=412623 RepID=UPI003604CACD